MSASSQDDPWVLPNADEDSEDEGQVLEAPFKELALDMCPTMSSSRCPKGFAGWFSVGGESNVMQGGATFDCWQGQVVRASDARDWCSMKVYQTDQYILVERWRQ